MITKSTKQRHSRGSISINKVSIGARIDSEVDKLLKEYATEHFMTNSKVVEEAIKMYCTKQH